MRIETISGMAGMAGDITKTDPEIRFREALKKALLKQSPDIRLVEGHSGKADGLITAQITHVPGPDTPFLIQLCLFEDKGGKPGQLWGAWSGSAASVFLFSDRMRRPDVHPGGIAGDMVARLLQICHTRIARKAAIETLPLLKPGALKVFIETSGKREIAIHQGGSLETVLEDRIRLRAELPRAKSITILAQDRNGQWLDLFVPEREVGVFEDGSISVPLHIPEQATGDMLTVWVIAGLQDECIKSPPTAQKTADKGVQTPLPARPDTPVQVLSGVGHSEGSGFWETNPVLGALGQPDASTRFAALKFTMRLSKPVEIVK
jgi:hypothetical protein